MGAARQREQGGASRSPRALVEGRRLTGAPPGEVGWATGDLVLAQSKKTKLGVQAGQIEFNIFFSFLFWKHLFV